MKKLLLLAIGSLLIAGCSGCGQQQIAGSPTNHYDKYVDQFNKDLMRLGYTPIDRSKLSIFSADELKNSDGGLLGYCYSIALKPIGPVEISFHKILLTYGDDIQTAMVYHELGHGFMGLKDTGGHVLMNGIGNRTQFTYAEMMDESKRLQFVRQMVESSGYR